MGSLTSSFIPAGRLGKTPFPLALHRGGSVLAVKGSLRRFAPWTAAGRSERRAAYEGKGGDRAVGREGELVHDKGYYHSYPEGADAPKGTLSALLPALLMRNRIERSSFSIQKPLDHFSRRKVD